MLADIRPEPNRLRVRPKEFGVGLLMLVCLRCVRTFRSARDGSAPVNGQQNFVWWALAGGLFFVSLVILAKTIRKIEFLQFVSNQGTAFLDVARAGPQRASFQAFVEALIGQIRSNRTVDT